MLLLLLLFILVLVILKNVLSTNTERYPLQCSGFPATFSNVVCFCSSSPPVGQGLLNHEVSRSHTTTHHSRTPLDEWSARRRDLHLTTHNTRNRQTSMPPVGFEPTISAGEWPQTYTLDRAATGTGKFPKFRLAYFCVECLTEWLIN